MLGELDLGEHKARTSTTVRTADLSSNGIEAVKRHIVGLASLETTAA